MSSSRDIAVAAFTGATSGVFSYYLSFSLLSPEAVLFLPGLAFGASMTIYFHRFQVVKSTKRLIMFLILSTVSYSISLLLLPTPPLVGVLSGAFGALLVTIGSNYILFPVTAKEILVLALLGGISVLSYYVFGSLEPQSGIEFVSPIGALVLFITWQASIAAGLGWIGSRSKPTTTKAGE